MRNSVLFALLALTLASLCASGAQARCRGHRRCRDRCCTPISNCCAPSCCAPVCSTSCCASSCSTNCCTTDCPTTCCAPSASSCCFTCAPTCAVQTGYYGCADTQFFCVNTVASPLPSPHCRRGEHRGFEASAFSRATIDRNFDQRFGFLQLLFIPLLRSIEAVGSSFLNQIEHWSSKMIVKWVC